MSLSIQVLTRTLSKVADVEVTTISSLWLSEIEDVPENVVYFTIPEPDALCPAVQIAVVGTVPEPVSRFHVNEPEPDAVTLTHEMREWSSAVIMLHWFFAVRSVPLSI